MAISYVRNGKYECYMVRVMRQGRRFAKAFRVERSHDAALRQAEAWEAKLMRLLGEPVPRAGRVLGKAPTKQFKAIVRCDAEGRLYMVAHYRSANGHWKHVDRSIEKYGWVRAAELAVAEAKRKHVVPKRVQLKKLPSDRRLRELMGVRDAGNA